MLVTRESAFTKVTMASVLDVSAVVPVASV